MADSSLLLRFQVVGIMLADSLIMFENVCFGKGSTCFKRLDYLTNKSLFLLK